MDNPTDSTPTPTTRSLLQAVAAGRLSPADAEKLLRRTSIAELGYATVDLQRQARRGRPEVIFCERKTATQVVEIARRIGEAGQNALMTRMTDEHMAAVNEAFGKGDDLSLWPVARLAMLRRAVVKRRDPLVAVLAAGTSDLPVAEEAALTAEALGSTVERAYDVGVAGLHRLLGKADLLMRARVIVAVAGMEGALPSVVAGLVACPVIAVPTSVGYGASFGGATALLAMINSCSPGIGVVNIDNGFGAGYLADSIAALADRADDS